MATCIYRGDYILRSLKWYRALHSGKTRRREGFFLIEGVRGIGQIAEAHPEMVDELLLDEAGDAPPFAVRFPTRLLTTAQFTTLCSSVTPQGIAAVLRIPEETYSPALPLHPGKHIVVLDEVQDPGNVGTIIRTAAAFNFSGVILSDTTADPFSAKAVQASAGAIYTPWIRRHATIVTTIRSLQADGYKLYCSELGGAPSFTVLPQEGIMVALGNEGTGLSKALLECADVRYSIPMVADSIESLNVAVAGAVSLFAVYQHCGWHV